MSTKRIVIPDIHHRVKPWRNFLARYGDRFTERYFLGDFQDDFYDTPAMAVETAEFVKELLEDPRNKLCLGNHDMPYFYPYNRSLRCPGFEIEKSLAVNKVLTDADWRKMKIAYVADGWLISHAGFHPTHFGYPQIPEDEITANMILEACDKALARIDADTVNGFDRLLSAGMDRGDNSQPYGGATWLDFGKLTCIPGINQIVGHTPLSNPAVKYMTQENTRHARNLYNWKEWSGNKGPFKSINWCIDTGMGDQFAIIEDGQVTVHSRDYY